MKPVFAFGNVARDLDSMQREHSDLNFLTIKQIHSDDIVSSADIIAAGPTLIEADALWTTRTGEAICIRTADCLPVLFFALLPAGAAIAAAHAGWRGVASNIIGKTVATLRGAGADMSTLQAWIGPHIRAESFEVGTEVAVQLAATYSLLPSQGQLISAHVDSKKCYVNLERLAVAEMVAAGIYLGNIHLEKADTYRDRSYHSFRRDGALAGRQTSFIALR